MKTKEKVLAKRTVYSGKILEIEEQDLDFGNGNLRTFEILNFKTITGVSALPVVGRDIFLIRHYQAGTKKVGYSLPTGGLNKGEDPVERMAIELREELKMKADKITLMFRSDILPSYIGSEAGYVFLAQELSPAALIGDEPFDIEVEKMSLEVALLKIKNGEITDTRTITAILYYKEFLA